MKHRHGQVSRGQTTTSQDGKYTTTLQLTQGHVSAVNNKASGRNSTKQHSQSIQRQTTTSHIQQDHDSANPPGPSLADRAWTSNMPTSIEHPTHTVKQRVKVGASCRPFASASAFGMIALRHRSSLWNSARAEHGFGLGLVSGPPSSQSRRLVVDTVRPVDGNRAATCCGSIQQGGCNFCVDQRETAVGGNKSVHPSPQWRGTTGRQRVLQQRDMIVRGYVGTSGPVPP